jgi:hypothetical protein
MQQVIYANGLLFGALDTAVNIGSATKAGVAYYVILPRGNGHAPSVVRQGILGLANNNLTYPAIGVNKEGRGMIAFTLLGADYYPSAAYVSFDLQEGTGPFRLRRRDLDPRTGLPRK